MTDTAADGRLRWQCRRGLLELDLLLQAFLDQPGGYAAAGPTQRAAFERLLRHSDEVLLKWLLLQQAPPEPELADVVQRIRRAHPV